MPFYGTDFYESENVRLMDPAEQGTYLRALWRQWREESLPSDPIQFAKVIEVAEVTAAVLDCFPVGEDGRRRNGKLEKVRAKHEAIQEQKREAARARWKQTASSADAQHEQTESTTEATLIESEPESDTEPFLPHPPRPRITAHAVNGSKPSRAPPGWVNEAVEIYAKHIGIVKHGHAGGLLKPVVQRRGWPEVKAVLECFCELAPYQDYLQRCESGTLRPNEEKVKKLGYNTKLSTFVENYTYWAEMTGVTA